MKYKNVKVKYYKEDTVGIHDTIQSGIKSGLSLLSGNFPVLCKNWQTIKDCKRKYLIYIGFSSLYAAAMTQALSNGETRVCHGNSYTQSTNIDFIYTIDIKYHIESKELTKKYPFFPDSATANIEQCMTYQMLYLGILKPYEKLMQKQPDKKDYVNDVEMFDWY